MTHLALYSSSGVRSGCSASLPVWNRRTVMRLWHMHGWFAGYVAPRAVSLTACRLWLSALSLSGQASLHSSGVLTVSSGTRLDLCCFDLRLRYQRWRWLLEGIEFVGNFVVLAGYYCLQRGKGGADACGLLAVLARAGSSGAGCVEDSCLPHFCSLRNSLSSR